MDENQEAAVEPEVAPEVVVKTSKAKPKAKAPEPTAEVAQEEPDDLGELRQFGLYNFHIRS